jgi:flagellar basal-body rod protein FlgB
METPKLRLLAHAMQAYVWRTQALASNIANLDTPGYQRIAVSFEDTLQQVQHHVPSLQDPGDVAPRMVVEDGPSILEDELMELADTQMRTQFATRALHEHFSGLRLAITGRPG